MSKVEAIRMIIENIDTIIDVFKDKVETEHNCATPVADDDELHYLCEAIVEMWEEVGPHMNEEYRKQLITEEGGWMQFVGFCFLAGDQLSWDAKQIAEYVVETYHGFDLETEVPQSYADVLSDMTKYAEALTSR